MYFEKFQQYFSLCELYL